MHRNWNILITALTWIGVATLPVWGAGLSSKSVSARFDREVRPLVERYCQDCHNAKEFKGDLDLARFRSSESALREPKVWLEVMEQMRLGEMPPKDKPQPTPAEKDRLLSGVEAMINQAARAQSGDPGPVVLRRLNNAEYTYTLRDLTGVDSLSPAREFPADSAAGEGFMNTGNALVMSPALLTKYLDAAKAVAGHAVLLPDGIRFSASDTERDWTDEALARIRAFYRPFVKEGSDEAGVLPLEGYLRATLDQRKGLSGRSPNLEAVAQRQALNPRYLSQLWNTLNPTQGKNPSLLLEQLHQRWSQAQPQEAPALAALIGQWQKALWKFNSVGHLRRHLGGTDGPKAWMEPVDPLQSQLDVRLKLEPPADAKEVVVYLAAGDAGDGSKQDVVVWHRPELVVPGQANLPLKDVRGFIADRMRRREIIFSSTEQCLGIAAELGSATGPRDLKAMAQQKGVDPEVLGSWLDFLGIGSDAPPQLDYFKGRIEKSGGYEFIRGWGTDETPLLVANSSDQAVRVPGNMKAHAIAVHPSPTLQACVGWRSPIQGTVRVEAVITHAHPECGNGVTWTLELRRGTLRQPLANGVSQGGKPVVMPPIPNLALQRGDLISLQIGPRDGNHSCDLTDINLRIVGSQEWDLSRDVSPDVLASNPHADSHGNPAVWHFYAETVGKAAGATLPQGSLLAQWQSTSDPVKKAQLATAVQALLKQGISKSTPAADVQLFRQLSALGGPLFARSTTHPPADSGNADGSGWGLDPNLFGPRANLPDVDPLDLCIQAPGVLEIRLPSEFVSGCEWVTRGSLHPSAGREGSVQLVAQTSKPNLSGLTPGVPVVVHTDSSASQRLTQAFHDFRQLFPAALCYKRIVPVDEAVTLTLYHREDEPLQRLMLNPSQVAELNRLWDELFFISREPIQLQAAFEQIYEYATQDRPDMVQAFGPMREPIRKRAQAFRDRRIQSEPSQLNAVLKFADRAYRHPLSPTETQELRDLYTQLRTSEIPHDEALRLVLAKIWVSPSFLYRLEQAQPGSQPKPVSDWELATRLSYFLWSSTPDEELTRLAQAGRLHQTSVLSAQTRRMLRDPKIRRLAEEFGCTWLHVHDFPSLDEKSERHFPTFAGLRESMYEETLHGFTDLFQNNRSVLHLVDADFTFLNEDLAQHYGIPGVHGKEWRRVDGVRAYGRGGILAQATTLSKQSGASRTSPILRGNWFCETLLGEKLPRPPKGVPVLPEIPPQGLTERQLTEKHSTDPKCAGCHIRVDPYGYSLEGYDAIGRKRTTDAAGLEINTQVKLIDGTTFDGLEGLKQYVLQKRREAFLRQFHRKLLGYALGRSLQISDTPLVNELVQAQERRGHRVGDAVEQIVLSPQFRELRGRDFIPSH